MSAPARSLPSPIPKRADPSRTPAARPRATPSPHHRARARRGTPPFWVMTALIVTAMVVGIVSLSALAVQPASVPMTFASSSARSPSASSGSVRTWPRPPRRRA